jgi:capsid portal protein
MSDKKHRVAFLRESRPLFHTATRRGKESWSIKLLKGLQNPAGKGKDADNTGIVAHPFDWRAAKQFKNGDPHHSTCIEAKRESTVGLGFEEDKIDDKLDDLTQVTWQDVITSAVEDFWLVGNGFIEVVRQGNKIRGLHHVAAERVNVVVESDGHDFHYRILSLKGRDIRAAAFGDKKKFMERKAAISTSLAGGGQIPNDADEISEIIHIKRPTSLHKWYGMPDWLAAVAQIELAHAITQYNYDFFLNSGVPEFVLLISGADIGEEWETEIKPALQAQVGMGNSHKTLALNLPQEGVQLSVEKLGEEMAQGWFESMLETVASRIVSAHRVPPLLAGIQIPGKLGANNEFINAMWMFQSLVIRPAQTSISKCLKRTLGSKDGIEGLKSNKFEMKTIVEEVPVAQVEAPGSMNEPNKEPGSRKDVKGTAAANRATVKKWEDEMREKYGDGNPEVLGKALGALLHAVFNAEDAAA